jgi:hypothetical protein
VECLKRIIDRSECVMEVAFRRKKRSVLIDVRLRLTVTTVAARELQSVSLLALRLKTSVAVGNFACRSGSAVACCCGF